MGAGRWPLHRGLRIQRGQKLLVKSQRSRVYWEMFFFTGFFFSQNGNGNFMLVLFFSYVFAGAEREDLKEDPEALRCGVLLIASSQSSVWFFLFFLFFFLFLPTNFRVSKPF